MPEIECDSVLMNVVVSQTPVVPFGRYSPDRCMEHLSRIVDLEDRLSSVKQQTRTAMDQATKSSSLLKKVSSLEDQTSILVAKIAQLKEWDIYIIEIMESPCEQLECKLPGAPSSFCC
jgi:hypothetical protein